MAKQNEKTAENLSLFQRLHNELEQIIESTPPGEKLKSEPDLAANLGVSRATLREAMRSFEGRGMIRRQQGVGTFVMDYRKNIETGLENLESIETKASKLGIEVSMGALDIAMCNANDELAEKMGIEEGQQLVRISRVIWALDRPVAYLVDNLLEGILDEHDLEQGFNGSVLDQLIQRGKPEISHSRTTISATTASSKVAKLMQLQRGDCLLTYDALLYDISGRIIDNTQSYYVPGFFKFHVNRTLPK